MKASTLCSYERHPPTQLDHWTNPIYIECVATQSLLSIDHRICILAVLKLVRMGRFWQNYTILADYDGASLDQLYYTVIRVY